MTKTNTRLLFSILLVFSTMLIYTGCVDTGVENIDSSFDFHSEISVANLVQGSGTATVTVDNSQIGTAIVGAQTGNTDLLSGSSRVMAVSFTSADAKTYQFSADTEAKIRFYLIDNGTSQSLVKDRLRYIWQTKDSEEGAAIIPPDTAQISVFNGSSNVAIDGLLISSSAIDTLVEMGGLSFGSKSSYVKLPAASATNFNVSVIIDGDSTLTSFTVAAQPQSRYTATIFGAGSTVGHSVLTDD